METLAIVSLCGLAGSLGYLVGWNRALKRALMLFNELSKEGQDER